MTPYHELCISHEVLRETFRCEDETPRLEGRAVVKYAVGFELGYPLGVWGGSCTCPDGRVYTAGDNGDICNSLACFGGIAGPCNQQEGIWAFREVHCAPSPPKGVVANSENRVVVGAQAAGIWGGTCVCPDGTIYLVGDSGHGCEGPMDLACYGGGVAQSTCIKNEGEWSHRQVTCAPVSATPKRSANTVLENVAGVGEWGGTCRCPDGEEYLVGSLVVDGCGELACVGGYPGLCNEYRSVWAHRKVSKMSI